MATPFAFVSLVTSDQYLPGALALVAALKELHSSPAEPPEVDFQTVCLVTPETVDVSTIKLLRKAFDIVIGVEIIQQRDDKALQLLGRPDLSTVLTKLHIFRLTQYSKVIFLDADVLPIRPLSHLFNLQHDFSAVPDVGWPDIFNSGVLVFSPGEDKFNELMTLLDTKGSWDGGDQGILNEWRDGNWHRLSFTYNTTPTAAYTYAPAYERYGSQISAIHFIGPNKPWSSIPYRAPGTKNSQPSDIGTQPTYEYAALVDRWYDVYDRNYRLENSHIPAVFEETRYNAAWDTGNESVAATVSGAASAPPASSVLGLEDLRKIAVEGISSYHATSEGKPSEGEYRSMPLEGRVDLMRPKREEEHKDEPRSYQDMQGQGAQGDYFQQDGDQVSTPRQNQNQQFFEGYEGFRTDTLPTPGPNEVPPAPWIHGHSLPPSTAPTRQGSYHSTYQPTDDQSNAGQGQQYSAGGQGEQSWGQASGHGDRSDEQRPSGGQGREPGTVHEYRAHRAPSPQQHRYVDTPDAISHSDGAKQNESHNQQHDAGYHESHRHHRHAEQHGEQPHQAHHSPPRRRHSPPPRPSSPPKLSWNPAVEPPPNNPPSVTSFPSDTYFPNIWDQPRSQYHDATHQSYPAPASSPPSDVFFHPPPPSTIPDQLIRQGEYANVFGHDHGHGHHGGHESHVAPPTPDPAKVHAVFPWEDKPRHFPRRVFPVSDSPAVASQNYIEKDIAPPRRNFTPHRPAPDRAALHSSPPIGLPYNLAYANAWDTVPSIQKYASRLVKPRLHPAPPKEPENGWVQLEKERARAQQERQDASSMDGDDEDESEDEEAEDDNSVRWTDSEGKREKHGGSGSGKRSRASSSAAVTPTKSNNKKYRSRSVQTTIIETQSIGVQVKTCCEPNVEEPEQPTKEALRTAAVVGVRREWPSTSSTTSSLHLPLRDLREVPDQSAVATSGTPLLVTQTSKSHLPFPSKASPTGLRSPQTLGSPRTYSPPKLLSPYKQPSPPRFATPPKVATPPKLATPPKVPTPPKVASPVDSPRRSSLTTPRNKTFTPPVAGSPATGAAPLPPATSSPRTSPKLTRLASPFATPMARTASLETPTSVASSPSTSALLITPENTPILPSRKGGRVWDPARGVDVFKRTSEEVLARFLRMGSFDEHEGQQQQQQQPQPQPQAQRQTHS